MADELLEGVAAEIGKAVPYDGAMWFGIDPTTLLAVAPARMEHLDDGLLQHVLVRRVPRAGRQPLRRPGPRPVAGGHAADGHRRPADAQRPLPRLPAAAGLGRRAAASCSAPAAGRGARRGCSGRRAATRSTPARRRRCSRRSRRSSAAAFRTHAALAAPTPGFTHAPGLMLFDRRRAILSANDAASRGWPTSTAPTPAPTGSSVLAGSATAPTSERPSRSSRSSPAPTPSPPAATTARLGCGCATGRAAGSCCTPPSSTAPRPTATWPSWWSRPRAATWPRSSSRPTGSRPGSETW